MNSEKQSTNLQMILREVNRVGEGKKNVPKLRFKGYEDAWEQRKFIECINNIVDYRGKTPKKLEMNWSPEGYLALSALNVKDGYIDFELDANYGDIELYNAWMKQDLSKGQVVFTTEAPMGNVAQIPDDSKYILSQRVIAFEVAHEKITDDFLATLLKSPKVFDDLTSLATGGTAKGVSQRSLSKLSVKIPQIIEEQNKIAKIICTLNKAITLHQRKYDALKTMKKTLLSKMFPKDGEDVPEIRFKGFTDAWEQRKLGALVQFVNGRAYKQEELLDVGKYKVVRVGNFNTNEKWYFSDLELETDKYMDNGDLLYLWATSFGPVIWQGEKAIFHYHIWKLKNFENLDKKYLYSFLEWDKNKISQNTNGSTMVHITKNMIEQRDIEYPTKSEQYRIGSLLESVDNLITLHQRKLEELKNMKKTLLQQMFV